MCDKNKKVYPIFSFDIQDIVNYSNKIDSIEERIKYYEFILEIANFELELINEPINKDIAFDDYAYSKVMNVIEMMNLGIEHLKRKIEMKE